MLEASHLALPRDPSLPLSLGPSVPAGAAALTGAGRVLSDEPPRQEPHRQRCGREPEPRLAGPRLPLRQTRGIPCLFSPLPDLPAPLPPSTATFTSAIPPPRRPRRLPAFKAPRATPPRTPHPSSLIPHPASSRLPARRRRGRCSSSEAFSAPERRLPPHPAPRKCPSAVPRCANFPQVAFLPPPRAGWRVPRLLLLPSVLSGTRGKRKTRKRKETRKKNPKPRVCICVCVCVWCLVLL